MAKSRQAGECRDLAGDATAPGCLRWKPRCSWSHLQDSKWLGCWGGGLRSQGRWQGLQEGFPVVSV